MKDNTGKVVYSEYQDYVLTHVLTPFGPVPTAYDPNGVYPYVSYCETSHRPVLKKYIFIVLENAYLQVTVCPDLGGKVMSMVHKPSNKEVLYVPAVIRYTRILPRFYFVAGGIEVSFPIAHSPVQNEKVLYTIDGTQERVYVTCGERELRFGMHWSVEYSLGPEDTFLTQRVIYHNPGSKACPWMSWSNAALPSAPDTTFHFPQGEVLSHASTLNTIRWETEGPQREADIKEMTGYFWKTKAVNAFGVFTPSLGTGLYHIADEKETPGIKLWSYGVGEDRDWAMLSTNSQVPYLEIQAGPIADQSVKLTLQPKETGGHTEYWIPSDQPLDIYAMQVPEISLRSVKEIPLFTWARSAEVQPWVDLLKASKGKFELQAPPEMHQNCWPPSGMENLAEAFPWAIAQTDGKEATSWKFYYGSWLAGKGEAKQAMNILSSCDMGLAKVLLARLLRISGEVKAAVETLTTVKEPWLQKHPQVVVERDQTLRMLGTHTLAEREQWLQAVDASADEWIIERKVQLLIDKEDILEAKELLLSFPFQKIHQTYTRTHLWKQLCDKLEIPCFPVPKSLGEDNLAVFGAYREFEK